MRSLEQTLARDEARLAEDPSSFEAAWQAAKVCADLLDATWGSLSREERIALAERGIAYARCAVAIETDRPEGHFAAAVCHGLLGKAKGLGGKKAIQPIIESCERVLALDPAYAGAGAHRILGALYLKAPAWPVSVGDLERSREELEAACRLAPEVPENHLFLARTLVELEEHELARRAFHRYWDLAASVPLPERPRFWAEEEREIFERLTQGKEID